MIKVDLRNILEYEAKEGYDLFMKEYKDLCYSDSPPSREIPRTPQINSFEQYQEFLKESNIFFIISSEDEEIGYIILDVFNNGIAQIQEIAICEKYRRNGYGRKAIMELSENLKEDEDIKVIKVYSETIATDRFFDICGFYCVSEDIYEYKLH